MHFSVTAFARTILRIRSRVEQSNGAEQLLYIIEAYKNATMRTCTFDPRVFIHNFTVPISVGLEIMCHTVFVKSRLEVVGHIGWVWALV